MIVMNRCEAEVDAIRDKLYEKYKDMTPEEHTRYVNEQAQRLAAQYGLTVGKPQDILTVSEGVPFRGNAEINMQNAEIFMQNADSVVRQRE